MTINISEILAPFDLQKTNGNLDVYTPINGAKIASVQINNLSDISDYEARARKAFMEWRILPPPIRGEFVRLLGQELRDHKENLGRLVTLECGKILSEGLGEVQEMIDICDFAVGLSRQIYGLTIASERSSHHMRETWQPLGPVGIITAFNFPVAVWCWNAALALVCGNSLVWKPSEKTPLTALACQALFDKAAEKFKAQGHRAPDHLSQVLIGERDIGEALVTSDVFSLISATGSVPMGRAVGEITAARMGRSLLELGGNNAIIVAPSADIKMALSAIAFGAAGTCGQRCTTTRRLIVHESIAEKLQDSLIDIYKQLRIGNPLNSKTLVGPLIDQAAFTAMQSSIEAAKEQGGDCLVGGRRHKVTDMDGGFYVDPAIIKMPAQSEVVRHETFAPILYVLTYKTLDEAIAMNNDVPQGLSSAIFTTDMREAETFLSAVGSDCGIANVNIGTSGAEIGGAFGGEKESGGGRESGSDAWKIYMRRQTQTINYGCDVPLAQGVTFDVE